MFKALLLGGAFIAIADPILLYSIYTHWGAAVFIAFLVFPFLAGPALVAVAQRLSNRGAKDVPATTLGDGVLLFAARLLFLFPGPISSVLGLFLLIPIVRQLIGLWVMSRLSRAVASGSVTVFPGMPGMGGMGGMSGPASGNTGLGAAPGNLKQAEGRVIEPGGMLGAPEPGTGSDSGQDDPESPDRKEPGH